MITPNLAVYMEGIIAAFSKPERSPSDLGA